MKIAQKLVDIFTVSCIVDDNIEIQKAKNFVGSWRSFFTTDAVKDAVNNLEFIEITEFHGGS